MTGNDIYGSGSKFGVAEGEIYGTGNGLNRKKPWFLEIFEIFVFQNRFCPWIRSKFKNRATSCTLSGFVAYSCKFSRLCVRPIVLDASDKLFPQFATVTLKLGQGQKFCSQTVELGKIFGYAKFCLATLKTLPLRSIRVWRKKKKRKIGLSQPMKPTTLASCNNWKMHKNYTGQLRGIALRRPKTNKQT